jgi:hypothetical protein
MLTCCDVFKFRGKVFLLIWTVFGRLNSILTAQVGIGTGTPEADLDLSGGVELGANGSVIDGVRRFTTSHTIPSDWPEELIVIELDQTQLQSLGMSSSALIHVQLRGSLSRLLSISHQGMDEQGFHITLEGIVPSMLGQAFEIDYLAFF